MDLQLHVQLVPITTKVESSNPVHGEVYSIQHYVITFVSTGQWFSPGTPVFISCYICIHQGIYISAKVGILIYVIVVSTKQDTNLNCVIHISMVCVLNTTNALNNSLEAEH